MTKAEYMVSEAETSADVAGASAFEEVYRAAYLRMTRVAHMLTGHNDIAEEVVQDAFVGLYQRFDRVTDPDGYLYRSVVNGCRQRFRRRQVNDRLRTLRVVTEVAPPEIDETWRALDRLTPRRRAAVVLRYYADLSEADIAEALARDRPMNDLDTPTEQQLARRLGELAATTEVARDAWDRLVGRTVDAASPVSPVSPSTSGSRLTPPGVPGFARRHARPLLAAAAALAVVVGLAVTQGHDDEDGLRTSDSNTRTTEDRGEPTRRPTTTTSAPPSTSTSSTTPAETGPAGPQETGSEAPAGGAARPPAAPSSPGETGESDRAAPRRAAPTMTLRTSDYTVEVIAVPGFDMYFRRTDGVGTHDTQPDGYGYDSFSGWQDTTSPRCLMSGGGSYSYPDAATHTFTYGLAGADIARIELILAGGQRQAVTPGPAANVGVGGYRAWLVERQPGTLQGIEAFDAAGDVVAAITAVGGGGDDFGWSVDTC